MISFSKVDFLRKCPFILDWTFADSLRFANFSRFWDKILREAEYFLLFLLLFFQNRNQERKAGKNDFLVFMLTEGIRSVCFHITDWEHKNDIQNWSKSYKEIDFYIVESTWADVSLFIFIIIIFMIYIIICTKFFRVF